MKKWIQHMKKADFYALGQRFSIDPVVARIMRNRGLEREEEYEQYLYGGWEQLYEPSSMKGLKEAVSMIEKKIADKKSIRIIGDYDIDGVNATYILYRGLIRAGAIVDSAIPDRMADGYGINENLIRQAYEAGRDTIITCDNGIAAREAIAYAKSLGMTVVITDHHDVPYEENEHGERTQVLPPADAIADPKQEGCDYPCKIICGAVVAFKFIQLLYQTLSIPLEETKEFLQFAAMATIGDVMELRDENRILVKLGLQQLRTRPCPGIRALMEETGILPGSISSYHIGFVIGPCLNASGRLETAKHALKLLQAENSAEANVLARKLKMLNDERKTLTESGMQEAFAQIEHTQLKEDTVLVVYLPDCHESLAGIIAGRIRERYYRPVLVFTDAEGGVKGSGRSIEGYHMFEELTKCKDLFTKYGGHPMAAGVSMPKEHLASLRQRLNANQHLTQEDLVEKVYIDAVMPLSYISESMIAGLNVLEPFGNGNAKPIFALQHIQIRRLEQKGRERKILKMLVSDGTAQIEAVYFGNIEEFEHMICEEFGEDQLDDLYSHRPSEVDLAILYYPTINEYMGRRTLQINIQEFCHIK
ncbi:MAG: single-stranded-DNA-specific exonuclease RecJ [Lachnospiraceae bacterium]|nr:single-stranded-DNA-specific exonuclease RecJ [Lachnospiraceae bacterium]